MSFKDRESKQEIKFLSKKIEDLATQMENIRIAEYVEILKNPKKLFWTNFSAGIARGIGMAVGFTILGAVVVYFLQMVVRWNLPLIGDFIAEIVRIVNINL